MKLVALLAVTVAMGWAAECEQKITVYLRGRSIVPTRCGVKPAILPPKFSPRRTGFYTTL